MACRGVHFAISDETAARMRDVEGDDDALLEVVSEVEETWDRDWLVETDKAWDAIHRCLTDGSLEWGASPGHKCILGERNLYEGDDYLINLLSPGDVRVVAATVCPIDKAELRRRYSALDPAQYDGPMTEEDFEYTWENLRDLQSFFAKAAGQGRWVLFSVDQ
jgi:hypothetical protein